MNIYLDEKYCNNFAKALKTEWLEINNLGTYSSSTIYGLNNRKEHGLFVVPTSDPLKKINLLAKMEETVFVKDLSFELSSNQYENSIYPDGHKHLNGFSLNPFPIFHYLVSNRRIDKSVLLLHDKNVLVIRYELKNNGDPVKLIIKPIIAARTSNNLIKDIQGINPDSYMDDNFIKIAPRSDLPEIIFSFNRGEYTPAALWYHNFSYNNYNSFDKRTAKEDLLNPGFFTYVLEPYNSFEIYVSLDEWHDFDYEYLQRSEKEFRRKRNSKFKNLPLFIRNIAQKIESVPLIDNLINKSCLPNYHVQTCSTFGSISTMIDALILQKNDRLVNKFIEDKISKLKKGLLFERSVDVNQVQTAFAETSLNLINLGYQSYKFFKNSEFLDKILMDPFVEIIDNYRKGTELNIFMDKDGLVFAGDKNTIASSFSSTNNLNQVERYGKLLEVNILWLNALYIMRYFSKEIEKSRLEKKFLKLINKAAESFDNLFWDEKNSRLFDFIRDKMKGNTFRINQIYALSMPFKILEKDKGKRLLYSIKDELLSNYGLRSLSKKDADYFNIGELKKAKIFASKFDGVIWPSSISDYFIACINYGNISAESFELNKLIENFEILTKKDCLGYIPEYLLGEEPNQAIGNAASITNMLSILKASFYFYKSKQKNRPNV